MLNRIITTNRAALLVLPYVAPARENADCLEPLLAKMSKRVLRLWGGEGYRKPTASDGVVVRSSP